MIAATAADVLPHRVRRPSTHRRTSAAASPAPSGVDVLLNKESKRETPSVVTFTSKQRMMGTDAGGYCPDCAADRRPRRPPHAPRAAARCCPDTPWRSVCCWVLLALKL